MERDQDWYAYLQDFTEFVHRKDWDNPTYTDLVEAYLAHLINEEDRIFVGDIDKLEEWAKHLAEVQCTMPDFKALYPPDPDADAKRDALKERLLRKKKNQ